MNFFSLFKMLENLFRRITLRTLQIQSPSPGDRDETARHHRVLDLTGQLCNISRFPIARGGYSDVWKCDWIKDGTVTKVAVKAIRRQCTNEKDALSKALERCERELEVWMRLRHDHVLPLYGMAHEFIPGTTAMVCPWLENGTVTSYIASCRDLTGCHRLQLISDVAAGLRYLHSQAIVHGDLTGSNILVCIQGRAYLADFGLSMMLAEHNRVSHSVTGAVRWAAPELITCPDPLSLKSDMYSFGSVMFHILSGVMPYHGLSDNQVIWAIMKGKKPARPEGPQISDRQWDFIQQCWLPFERRLCRPSADNACNFLQYDLAVNFLY